MRTPPFGGPPESGSLRNPATAWRESLVHEPDAAARPLRLDQRGAETGHGAGSHAPENEGDGIR